MKKSNLLGLCSIALITVATMSCSVFLPVTIPEVQTYQIALPHSNSTECKPRIDAPDLLITRMKAEEPYDSDNMYYAKSRYQLNHYSRNQWVAAPNIMLTKVIQEKLLQSCEYGNVVNADFMTSSNYRLNTQLLELQQNINESPAVVTLAVLVQLVDNKANRVVKSKTFIEKTTTTANPAGYVDGTNIVVTKFLANLLAWLK